MKAVVLRTGNKSTHFKKSLLAISLMTISAHGMAQAVDAKKSESKEIEKIQVTGSHIMRGGSANFTSSAPITEVDASLIEGTGSISVEDTLNRVPSITSELSASSNNLPFGGTASNIGVSTTSLRNLGSARTLVLVNGRRYVSGVSANSGYGVDLNSIPTSIIERVDVLTGGQSAIYGSDAVAGVINIITKKDFNGAELNTFGADSEQGGAARQNVDFTYGKNFDAGNAWVSVGVANQDGLNSADRDFAKYELSFIDTNKDGIVESIARRNGPAHVPGAALSFGNLFIFGNGQPFNTNQPVMDSNFVPNGSSDFDNQHASRKIVSPYKRFHIASGSTFDISDDTSAELEINFSQTTATAQLEPIALSVRDNVFMVGSGGTSGIDIATSPYFVGSSAGQQLLSVMGNNTSFDRISTFRRMTEFGPQVVSQRRNTFRTAGSISTELANDMMWTNSLVFGMTSQTMNKTGDIALTQLREAMQIESDGKGGYRCVDATARAQGCVPVNPFNTVDSLLGRAGVTGFSPAAVKYMAIDTGQSGELRQFVGSSVLAGNLPIELSDGPVSFAGGLEWRKEEARETPDSFRQLGIARDLAIADIVGSFDVVEAFTEFQAPVAEWLNLSLALRAGKYSTVGNTFTYRFGADAPVTDDLKLRAAYSSSVRAPNINDLYSTGATSTAPNNVDPCNGVTAASTGNIATNCRSIAAINQRITSKGAFNLVASEANNTRLLQTGSVALKEETADSITLGAVYSLTDDWSLSVDYYGIEIEDGITRVGPDVFVKRCYDVAASGFDATCGGNLLRDSNDGPILNLRSTLINASKIETAGVDVEVSYVNEGLRLNVIANSLSKFDVTDANGAVEEFVGRPLYPEMRLTFNGSYDINDKLNIFTQLRYRNETQSYLGKTNLSDDLNTMDAATYVDLRVNYKLAEDFNVYIGTNNLFDVEPDINARPDSFSTGTNTEARAYDVIGRQYFAGLKYQF